MAIRRYVSIAFAAGVLAMLGMMMRPAHVAELWGPSIVRNPIPDSPAVPRSKQSRWNADRVGLSWAAPRDAVRLAKSAE
jgi:hypothetical protein